MDMFSNRIVIGLFDNQEDLGHALSKLHKQGFGEEEELVFINEDHVVGESSVRQQDEPFVVSPSSVSETETKAILDDDPLAEDNIPGIALEEKLMDLGIDEKEVSFYARQVKRGNTLVIVETDDKAQQAHDIMHQFNAKSWIS